jgi:long-chain acyl-CoA synthetase
MIRPSRPRAHGNTSLSPTTLTQLYFDAIAQHRKPNAFQVKQDGAYRDVSAAEFAARVERASLGLVALGIVPGDRVALLAENRLEWAIADYAILCARAVTVPIYPTLLPHQIEYQLQNSGAKIAFASTKAQIAKLTSIQPALPDLAHLVAFDPPPPSTPHTMHIDDLIARGADVARTAPERHRELGMAVDPEDLASIIYTSGTTGVPKGVMLSHRNIASNVAAMAAIMDFGPRDTCLSFLPLSHILERMGGHFAMLHRGVTIAYAESVESVPVNLLEARPTMVIGVPRLFEKMRSRVLMSVASAPAARQQLFQWALATGWEAAELRMSGKQPGFGLQVKCEVARRLVWKKIHARLGGRPRLLIAGGAPLSPDVARFFFSIGVTLLEGYGLTETSPVIAVNTKARTRIGTVGPPVPGTEVKIAPDGEVLTRGPGVMMGYYRDEAATEEAITRDGWFHTGDIGQLDADGFLSITDRKKDIIITAGGKNIAPQPIENRIKESPYIAEAVMVADQRKFPVALIVPDFAALRSHAEREGIAFTSDEDLCKQPEILDLVRSEVNRLSTEFAPYERIKKIALVDHEFSITTGELTPTMKLKRKVITEKYRPLIDALFDGQSAA